MCEPERLAVFQSEGFYTEIKTFISFPREKRVQSPPDMQAVELWLVRHGVAALIQFLAIIVFHIILYLLSGRISLGIATFG